MCDRRGPFHGGNRLPPCVLAPWLGHFVFTGAGHPVNMEASILLEVRFIETLRFHAGTSTE